MIQYIVDGDCGCRIKEIVLVTTRLKTPLSKPLRHLYELESLLNSALSVSSGGSAPIRPLA